MIFNESTDEFLKADNRTVIWIYDPIGCTGKAVFVKWIFINRPK